MSDYISRAELLKKAQKANITKWATNSVSIISADVVTVDDIKALPSADAEQVTSKLKKPCDSLLTDDSEDSKELKSKLDHDREWIIGCIKHDGFIKTDRFDKANQIILDALSAEQGWIPFTRRPMTEEEQKDYPNCTFMFDCVLPEDGDEILVSNGRFVWMDTFCNDIDGCYLDGGDDINEDMAWMPLPKPYKGGDDE